MASSGRADRRTASARAGTPRLGALALATLLVLAGCRAPLGEQISVPMVTIVNHSAYEVYFVYQWGLRWAGRLPVQPGAGGAIQAVPSPCFTTDVYLVTDDGRVVAVHHPPLCNNETWTIGPEATPDGTPTLVSPAPSYGPAATS